MNNTHSEVCHGSGMRPQVSFPKLVHFFGPDGSGKSTQADMLINFLDCRGVRAKKCWMRGTHTFAFLMWWFLIKIGFYRTVLNQFGIARRLPAVNRNSLLRLIWFTVELLGVIPWILRIHFLMLRGYKIVAERYVLDTVVSIAYTIGDAGFLESPRSRLLLCFIPKGTAFIFLDSDYETILSRRIGWYDQTDMFGTSEGHPPSFISSRYLEPEEVIRFQRNAYIKLAKAYNALIIDTSQHSAKESSNLVSKYLGLQ